MLIYGITTLPTKMLLFLTGQFAYFTVLFLCQGFNIYNQNIYLCLHCVWCSKPRISLKWWIYCIDPAAYTGGVGGGICWDVMSSFLYHLPDLWSNCQRHVILWPLWFLQYCIIWCYFRMMPCRLDIFYKYCLMWVNVCIQNMYVASTCALQLYQKK